MGALASKHPRSRRPCQGFDLVTNIPNYSNVKSALCKERRKALGTIQNPKDAKDIEISSEFLLLDNQESFPIIDSGNHQKKKNISVW